MGKIEKPFADLIQRLAGNAGSEVLLAARLVSNQCGEGHACVNLSKQAGLPLPEGWELWSGLHNFPSLHSWRKKLEESNVVGSPGTYSPLILDENDKLYLLRYFNYENIVLQYVRHNGLKLEKPGDPASLYNSLIEFFGNKSNELNWQKIAAIAAVLKPFCVISGGPGTGKTTTVAKIVALMADQNKGSMFRVALAAPTGKAAARLFDSIQSVDSVKCSEILGREEVYITPGTLHRLLGVKPGARVSEYVDGTPLPFEMVIVDEASMVDLPLMAQLMSAIAEDTRLILLGDREQLASVEPGSVFGDLCPDDVLERYSGSFKSIVSDLLGETLPSAVNEPVGPAVVDSIIQLGKNYRFTKKSGIQRVINAVRLGDADSALAAFDDKNYQDLIWHDVPSPKNIIQIVVDLTERGFLEPVIEFSEGFSLSTLEDSCLLCALRKGPYGVEEMNRLIRQVLVKKGMAPPGKTFFPGLPVMVIRNDYSLGLFNGDVGLVVRDTDVLEGFSVLFPGGQEGQKKISPALLPPYEPVFAMTVHKSQGMEFNQVCLVLPDRPSPVLTRELIYTAVSRARKKVEIWGNREVFKGAVHQRVSRESGLKEALWKITPDGINI